MTITITNPSANTVALTGAGVTDTFPAGLQVDAAPAATTSCGATFAPAANAASVSISNATVPVNGSCAFTVKVKGTTLGAKNNVTSAVTSTNGGTGLTATATLTITNTITWTGATSTDWNTASNWNPAFVPTSTNDVDIPAGTLSNEPTIVSVNVTVNSLTINTARTLTINGNRTLTVTNALTNGGTMNVAGTFTAGTFASTGAVNFTGTTAQTIPAAAYNNLLISNAAGTSLSGNTTVSGVLALTNGILTTGNNTLTVSACTPAAISGGSATSYVKGNLQRCLNNTGAFVFPVGTANGYSPVQMSNITGTGNFTVSSTQGTYSNPTTGLPTNRLARWWTLTNGGIAQADLQFNYLAGDITAGTESSYKVFKIETGAAMQQSTTLNTTSHTATVATVTAFSDWTLAEVLAPTAAPVSIGGRISTAEGRGISRAQVLMTDANGEVHYTRTNPFGYFRFAEVVAGGTYVFTVNHKQYQFLPQVVNVNENMENLNFTVLPK
jgi:hypothetical protein